MLGASSGTVENVPELVEVPIYGGDERLRRREVEVLPWQKVHEFGWD